MSGLSYNELSKTGVTHQIAVNKFIYHGKTKFQEISLIDTIGYQKALLVDGQMQSTTFDERIYHESLVQPVMMTHPNPKRVFIGGGGEGATAREVLKHKSVEECVMVDIDDEMCAIAKQYMVDWHQGSFDDPRFKLVNEDARKVLCSYPSGYFDVIILDLCDPLDYGPCYTLYSKEFYDECYDRLGADGVFVTQSACANPDNIPEVFGPVINTLKASAFDYVYPYRQFVPSFIDSWAFSIACKAQKSMDPRGIPRDTVAYVDIKLLDKIIAQRLDPSELYHYDGECHLGMFALPKWTRAAFAEEKRVICADTPIYVKHITSDKKGTKRSHEDDEAKE